MPRAPLSETTTARMLFEPQHAWRSSMTSCRLLKVPLVNMEI